jgi:beta-carotene ketolase (CrtO type)
VAGVKARFTARLLDAWADYAPNMTRENVIATSVCSPDDIARERPNMLEGGYSGGTTVASQLGRFRPIADLSGHRILLDNVYDCSANLHSGRGIGRGLGYNCFQEIARDMHLDQAPAAA